MGQAVILLRSIWEPLWRSFSTSDPASKRAHWGWGIAEAALVSCVLVCLVYPDVIFLGTGFRITDTLEGIWRGFRIITVYPKAPHSPWYLSSIDNGGGLIQMEPMIGFMRHSIWHLESPYWNPYSGAGALGPEVLVDNKFSLPIVANALLGGGVGAYAAVYLLLHFFGAFYTYRIGREQLNFCAWACAAMSLFFLLNGYLVASTASNWILSYFFVPVCLYVSFAFAQRPTATRFVALVLALAALLSCTFLPTTIVSVLTVYGLFIAFVAQQLRNAHLGYGRGIRILLLHGLAAIGAVLLLAFLYFPILENLASAGTFTEIAGRSDSPPRLLWPAILSMFSPSHFWESYMAMEPAATNFPGMGYITGTHAFHFGVVAWGLVGCALYLPRGKFTLVRLGAVLVGGITLLRLFDLTFISDIITHTPLLNGIGHAYWMTGLVFPMIFLVGFGFEGLVRREAILWPTLALFATAVAVGLGIYQIYGIREPHVLFKIVLILQLGLWFVLASLTIAGLTYGKRASMRNALIVTLLVLMFVELTIYDKRLRVERNDVFGNAPPTIGFLRAHIDHQRTMSFGQSIMRPEMGSAYQISEITTQTSGVFPAYLDYLRPALHVDPQQVVAYYRFASLMHIQDTPDLDHFDWDRIDFLGVKYLVFPIWFQKFKQDLIGRGFPLAFTGRRNFVLMNTSAFPRAFEIELKGSGDAQDIELPRDVKSRLRPANIVSYENASVAIEGIASSRTLVVLTDNWHRNWKASVNGEPGEILRVNGSFRGVLVPPGTYSIQMRYRPRTLPLALAVSGTVCVLLGVLLLYHRRVDGLFAWEA